MLCPECGEIVGPGPLDITRARKCDGGQTNPIRSGRCLSDKFMQWFGKRLDDTKRTVCLARVTRLTAREKSLSVVPPRELAPVEIIFPDPRD